MAKGYWIAHVTVTDPDNYPKYLEAVRPAFEKYGATFIVRGGQYAEVEGPAREHNVVVEFDSFETAKACYHSPEYAAAAKLRHAYADSDFVIVEGTD